MLTIYLFKSVTFPDGSFFSTIFGYTGQGKPATEAHGRDEAKNNGTIINTNDHYNRVNNKTPPFIKNKEQIMNNISTICKPVKAWNKC